MKPRIRRALRASWLAALTMVMTGQGDGIASAAPAGKPNVVLLVADDLGFGDLGFQGARDIPTPHLDALAQGGVRCTNGYVSGPYCSPTRAGLLTGRYQQRFGHEFNPGNGSAKAPGLPVSETTLADRLKAAGYATGLVGKWHLGSAAQFHPQKRGFDEFFGFLGGQHTYFAGKSQDIYRGGDIIQEEAYLTDAFAREALSFIDRHKDHPFFLQLSFNAVHTPMDATEDRVARFAAIEDPKRRTYAAMVSALDEAAGKVIERIRSAGLEESTLIIFFSDNGGPTMLGTTTNGSRNVPLRGSKRTTLEGGVRVPFVLSWKGTLPAGKVYEQPIIQLDILPTALAAAGVAAKPEWKLDGVNLLPHLNGHSEQTPHDALYWRLGEQAAIRRGDWKLVRYDQTVDIDGAKSNGSKPPVTPFRLYNLTNDIGEAQDLSAENPDKTKELLAAWEDWSRQLAPPLWRPGNQPAKPVD
ncbi:sulfatase-like hydrolase/transferase [Singulisphaera sp. Ch08]|uniref:Sulfatase-like hydrolase/transferase n=1 Tax=Singulisphaera sp. Ch08 TaxID=3120278 RepID=A0AAU7CHN5_9BACT